MSFSHVSCPARALAPCSLSTGRTADRAACSPFAPAHAARPAPVPTQGDGTAQLLCRGAAEQAEVCRIVRASFPGMACMPFTVSPTAGAAPPAGQAAGCAAAPAEGAAAPAANGSAASSVAGGAANGTPAPATSGLRDQVQQSLAAVAAKQKELQAAQQWLAELQAAAAAAGPH